jgi:hypothetical protein
MSVSPKAVTKTQKNHKKDKKQKNQPSRALDAHSKLFKQLTKES